MASNNRQQQQLPRPDQLTTLNNRERDDVRNMVKDLQSQDLFNNSSTPVTTKQQKNKK